MRPAFCIIILVFLVSEIEAQTYDLIVNTQGDSIACTIDSLSETTLFFIMKNNSYWITTSISIDQVIEYQYQVIDRNWFEFRPGTSYITGKRQEQLTSISDIQKNSLYVGVMSVSYSRMIPVKELGITLAAGMSFIDGVALQTETTLLLGNAKHSFEPGIIWWHDPIDDFVMIRMGYRYQNPKGFLFRVAPLLTIIESSFFVLPSLSVGFSF